MRTVHIHVFFTLRPGHRQVTSERSWLHYVPHALGRNELVSWSLTSLFSTTMAISETRQKWSLVV